MEIYFCEVNNMLKKKKLFLATSFISLAALMSVSVISVEGFNRLADVKLTATDRNASVTLDSNHRPVTNADTSYTARHQDLKHTIGDKERHSYFYYSSFKYESGKIGRLETGNVIYKTESSSSTNRERTNGIKSITVNHDGNSSLLLRVSYELANDGTITGNDSFYNIYVTSGTKYEIRGNYWELYAVTSTTIASINVEYGCEDPATNSGNGKVTGMTNTSSFASTEVIEGEKTYYRIKVDTSGDLIPASALSFYDGDTTMPIEKIEYRNANEAVIYGVLSKEFIYKVRKNDSTWYPHLKVNNENWNGTNGDIKGHSVGDGGKWFYPVKCDDLLVHLDTKWDMPTITVDGQANYSLSRSGIGKEDISRGTVTLSGDGYVSGDETCHDEFTIRFFAKNDNSLITKDDIVLKDRFSSSEEFKDVLHCRSIKTERYEGKGLAVEATFNMEDFYNACKNGTWEWQRDFFAKLWVYDRAFDGNVGDLVDFEKTPETSGGKMTYSANYHTDLMYKAPWGGNNFLILWAWGA